MLAFIRLLSYISIWREATNEEMQRIFELMGLNNMQLF